MNQKHTLIMGIDTSCDDTSVAILRDDEVLSSIVSSQIDVHKEWGGVVPNLARREHEKMIDGCIETALKRARIENITELNAIAVTYGPGLAPALEVGVRKAKELAVQHNIPLIAANHMEGHAISALLKNSNDKYYSDMEEPAFPALALCVSGGHTELVWIEHIGSYELLGQTLDDAAGEAFDKVSRMLDLGYPGGPVMSHLAEDGNPEAFELPRPMHNSQDYNFSFSGLKTACLYQTNTLKEEHGTDFAKLIPDYCASFQQAVIDSLTGKTRRAIKERQPKMLLLGGGVASNIKLRAALRNAAREHGIELYVPPKQFCTDNGAMIALAGYYKLQRGETVAQPETLDRDPSITIEEANAK